MLAIADIWCFHGFSDMKNLIGEAICNICQESFSTTITGYFAVLYELYLHLGNVVGQLAIWYCLEILKQYECADF